MADLWGVWGGGGDDSGGVNRWSSRREGGESHRRL